MGADRQILKSPAAGSPDSSKRDGCGHESKHGNPAVELHLLLVLCYPLRVLVLVKICQAKAALQLDVGYLRSKVYI